MKKELYIQKKFYAVFMMFVLLLVAIFLAIYPINAKAEAKTDSSTLNDTIYKELTEDDLLSGLNVTVDDYIANIESGYYIRFNGEEYDRLPEHNEHLNKVIPLELFKEMNYIPLI